jgi:hypothetical protein
MIAAAIFVRIILTAIKRMIFVETFDNVNVSAQFNKVQNQYFYCQHQLEPTWFLKVRSYFARLSLGFKDPTRGLKFSISGLNGESAWLCPNS